MSRVTAPPSPSRFLTLWVGLLSGSVLGGLWLGFVMAVGWPG